MSGILKSTGALFGLGTGAEAADETDTVERDLTEWVSSSEFGESIGVGTLVGVDGVDLPLGGI